MAESQNVEWKESWRDEYLKWICGFANAQGGTIYIGTDDAGRVTGVANSKKLMEDIPNKVRDTLGILVDINLHSEGGKDYLKIFVSPSSYPVNYKGEYHYRSGSTKQLLTGAALTEFLLSKTGFRWDAVPVDGVTADDLDKESFDIFRREALRSRRMTEDDLNITNAQLLDNLGLLSKGRLKRAAVMLFHREQEKWFTGAYVKIGYFETDSDLRYQDELHGSLMIQADRVIDLIFLKYMKADITYDNVTRVETYPVPKSAVREAVYNALIHCDYSAGVPIQISVYADKMYIGNSCIFPAGWTADTLMKKHGSRPHNPDIANCFFRAGLVEIWGRGIEKICDTCRTHGVPQPAYTVYAEDIMVMFAAGSAAGRPAIRTYVSELMSESMSELVDKSMTKLERTRFLALLEHMKEHDSISSAEAALALGVDRKAASRLLRRAETLGVMTSDGKTKNKKYRMI